MSLGVPKTMSEDHGEGGEFELLRRQLEEVRKQNEALHRENEDLRSRSDGSGSARPSIEVTDPVAPINEADVTLRRLVQRIAMILQAEKIVIMFHDRERGELIGIPPSYGVDEEHLTHFRVRASQGVSGEVFRSGEPIIFHDAISDPRCQRDPFSLVHAANGITVPLVIEKRDEENRVVERNTIGVLHSFNKRHGEDFNDEDVRLLERMARNVGSIIANLQLYREVVQEREELLQTFESLTAGLILVSPENRLSQINATARAIFSVAPDALGKNFKEAISNEEIRRLIEEARAGSEATKTELHVTLAGTTDRIYEAQSALVRGEDGKDVGVVVILSDVTEMRNIDKMKSTFVAMASHELRTPLTAIKGFSSTLLEGIDDEVYGRDEQKEFLGIVVSECDRLRRLIDDLLNTSRIEGGVSLQPSYSSFELLPQLEKAVAVQQQASGRHRVLLKIHNQLPKSIIGDQDKIDQILTNLLNNAIKYSPNGGDVTVHAKNEGDTILIGVQDQGLGIPKDHLNRVFERFHRIDNEDNRKIYGTGLGLYLVKHLVEQVHLGEIWAESEGVSGKGTTFWVRIPAQLDVEKAKALNDKPHG
ncbi:MAG TPA: ATP-binding protein [Fimbriimonadaceae bacterium]|nr:ATP-binding protein [Fimbriimonadaceae bacterium]